MNKRMNSSPLLPCNCYHRLLRWVEQLVPGTGLRGRVANIASGLGGISPSYLGASLHT